MIYDLTKIKKVQVELSSRCNASCPACSRNYSGGPVVEFDQVDLSVDDMKSFFPPEILKNLEHINYCGNLGDPGIVKDLPETLEYFKSYGIVQTVRTNGGMRSTAHWEKIAKLCPKPNTTPEYPFSVSGVIWGVDGLEDTNHIYRRGVLWDKVWANMQAYSNAGGYGIWEFLIFDHNKHQVEEAKRLAELLGFTFIIKTPLGFGESDGERRALNVHDKDGNFDYAIWPHDYQGEKIVPESHKLFKIEMIRHIQPQLSNYSSKLGKTSTIKCKSFEYPSYQEIFITASGHLLPCCYLGGAFGQKNTTYARKQFNDKVNAVGLDTFDLRKHSMTEILQGPDFNKFFNEAWNTDTVENGRMLFCVEVCGECSSHDKIYDNNMKVKLV